MIAGRRAQKNSWSYARAYSLAIFNIFLNGLTLTRSTHERSHLLLGGRAFGAFGGGGRIVLRSVLTWGGGRPEGIEYQ